MVLADGSFVTANGTRTTTCSGRVRGGGGNFGVVTSFTFRLHPISMVMAGPIFYTLEDAPPVMKAYERFITDAPEEINGFFAFLTVPPVDMFPASLHMRTVCGVVWCSTAGPELDGGIAQAGGKVGQAAAGAVGPVPFPALQSLFDGLYTPGCSGTGRPTSLTI